MVVVAEPKLKKVDKAILRQVREAVATTHWGKRAFEKKLASGKVQRCLVGHVNVACGLRTELSSGTSVNTWPRAVRSRRKRILDAIRVKTGYAHIESWNDKASTKREDVLALLDELIGDAK